MLVASSVGRGGGENGLGRYGTGQRDRTMRILVVEDEPLLAMLLEESLVDLGHEIAGSAATVEQALSTLDERSQEGETVEFGVLDYSLGHDTTALPIARWLRERGIPVMYLSGHASLDDDRLPLAPLLTKPFTVDQLDATIRGLALAA
ncbi:MAG TPA: response regulator [Novosphingobium sp.]|nr:response regulator [Novosphingobium sp.]